MLLKWGTDLADQQKLPIWLFARPAAMKMYLDAHFKEKAVIDINLADIQVPPMVCMLREPDLTLSKPSSMVVTFGTLSRTLFDVGTRGAVLEDDTYLPIGFIQYPKGNKNPQHVEEYKI